MISQKLIFERIETLEANHKESISRVHKRITDDEEHIKELHEIGDTTGVKLFN